MSRTRVIAIAVASGRMCYVCFEGKCLLDWALSHKASQTPKRATEYVAKCVNLLKPDVVITENTNIGCRKGSNTKAMIELIQKVVGEYGLLSVEMKLPRRFKNKYEEAAAYANVFPDIKYKMPKAPRLWESEPTDTVYIEAISLALEIVDSERTLVA